MRKVQKLVDQVQQMTTRGYAGGDHLMLLLRQFHVQQVGAVTNDGVQGRTQFMAYAGKKQTLGLVCGLSFFFCLRYFGDQSGAICRYHNQRNEQADR